MAQEKCAHQGCHCRVDERSAVSREINPTAVLIVQTPATRVGAGVAGAAILSATNRYYRVLYGRQWAIIGANL